MLRLFYRPKDESYYFIPEDKLFCDQCNNEIIVSVIFEMNWGKKKGGQLTEVKGIGDQGWEEGTKERRMREERA